MTSGKWEIDGKVKSPDFCPSGDLSKVYFILANLLEKLMSPENMSSLCDYSLL